MSKLKSENLIIFLTVFFLAVSAGLYLNFYLKLIFGDALVRSFHAYLVFFGNEPKLSAIGFVWPPLQTLLQLPLVLITPLNTNGFAANILSSIFFGISTVYLNKIGAFFKVKKILRYLILLIFITNPLVFFYGANGMSESIGIAFILMTLYYFLQHLRSHSIPALILASVTLSSAIMTRWEAGTLLFVLLIVIGSIPFLNKKYSFKEAESSVVMLCIPVFFAILIWLVSSWLIVGSPTYFLHSTYSFTEQDIKNLASNTVLSGARGNMEQSLFYILKRITTLSILFLPLLAFTIFKLKDSKNRLYALTLLGLSASTLLSQFMPIYVGKSYGQLRYFIYIIPLTATLLLFIFKDSFDFSLKKYQLMLLILISATVIVTSSWLVFYAMIQYGSREDNQIAELVINNQSFKNESYEKEEEVASYLLANIHSRSVLIDDSLGFNIVYLTKKPNLFIERVDSDFEPTLKNPLSTDVKYILLTNPKEASVIDSISKYYPNMFESGANFVTLDKDFGSWRLYKIKSGI